MNRHPQARQQQRGVALIEAMVGFLIFAVGVIGLMGLQASMVRAQTESKTRADAVALATELQGIMWADAATNHPNYTTAGCSAHPPCADWIAKVEETLPKGSFTLAPVITVSRSEQVLTLTWRNAGGDEHRHETEFALPL